MVTGIIGVVVCVVVAVLLAKHFKGKKVDVSTVVVDAKADVAKVAPVVTTVTKTDDTTKTS